ncbi:hypothetical protein ACVQK1_09300 [Edwardsiella tarda]
MSKTPCEKLGYKVGDKFVVVRDDGFSRSTVGDVLILALDDGSNCPIFRKENCINPYCPYLSNIAKIDGDGWIGWKGGEMPVERGTLVDVKYRDGMETVGVSAGIDRFSNDYKCKDGYPRSANDWKHFQYVADIVAYRLHQEEKPELEQAVPTLDDLMHAWQKAKANADTSRNILKLAEQDEAAARKALDDALRSAGWGETAKDEPLDITDWRDLKPGDIVWWSGDSHVPEGEYVFELFDNLDDIAPFAVSRGDGVLLWVDIHAEQWCFIRRPA